MTLLLLRRLIGLRRSGDRRRTITLCAPRIIDILPGWDRGRVRTHLQRPNSSVHRSGVSGYQFTLPRRTCGYHDCRPDPTDGPLANRRSEAVNRFGGDPRACEPMQRQDRRHRPAGGQGRDRPGERSRPRGLPRVAANRASGAQPASIPAGRTDRGARSRVCPARHPRQWHAEWRRVHGG
jgi:hypothetical protein